jgi:hypothetical protein
MASETVRLGGYMLILSMLRTQYVVSKEILIPCLSVVGLCNHHHHRQWLYCPCKYLGRISRGVS